MKTCSKCGASCTDEMQFCSECGEKLVVLSESGINSESSCEEAEPISFGEAFKLLFKRAFEFKGRESKREFWLGFAWWAIIQVVINSVSISNLIIAFVPYIGVVTLPVSTIITLASLASVVPILAAMWRRIQDTNKHGALSLLHFVSIIIPLILCFMDGTDGPNQYGEKPKR